MLLPRSLRRQFVLAFSALALLAIAGSLTAISALRLSSSAVQHLAEERLDRLQDAQGLVQCALLIEHESHQLMDADALDRAQSSYAEIIKQLGVLDRLVERLGAATQDTSVLTLLQAGQLFRNTIHVVTQMRKDLLEANGTGLEGSPRVELFSERLKRVEQEETLRRFSAELRRQALDMTDSGTSLSAHFTSDYRDAVKQLADSSRKSQWWVLALLAGDLVLAWLVFWLFLRRWVLARLLDVSHALRQGACALSGAPPRVPVQGSDEIAEMARAVERFLDDRQRLAEANNELETFGYTLGHDLRAPLRHVTGFGQLLQQRAAGSLDEQSRHYLDSILAAAGRMGTLIDDLLSFLHFRGVEILTTTVDVAALVREVVAELGPEIAGRTIDWKVGNFPPVEADRPLLRLALSNLLSNAVKFTRLRPRAEIEVGCTSSPDGAEVVLFVRDNGVGFDMKFANSLFRVFHRLHLPECFEGAGIGLASVRRIVELHGGRTWAEGVPDQGATFSFSLPQSSAETRSPNSPSRP